MELLVWIVVLCIGAYLGYRRVGWPSAADQRQRKELQRRVYYAQLRQAQRDMEVAAEVDAIINRGI